MTVVDVGKWKTADHRWNYDDYDAYENNVGHCTTFRFDLAKWVMQMPLEYVPPVSELICWQACLGSEAVVSKEGTRWMSMPLI